ncbi:monovalent cation:proton antiporter-2 (CPA2) family protein [Teredinibacter sp. KSP-S5-2]|uniref:monovalent cation:proton antiporter-2 (CPA2) family protein n=1 Tax=Teredinibacter sp. KSP-S5-2 TaxID=3034506 RepID=UPI0029349D37|nr:monovalent cation:proton antiporter-2 (CPA2) family protein [Teredinibacter sp. KSP-S5-2]WNO09413.1 monovalent cation:proton antiporter-2 (CPA2) family protein [Teredinibacter sp. KSP-S5-2]
MLISALIYLCAAVISVPIAKRLGLGSVLGYLMAGVAIGPFVLGLVGDQTEVMHFAEFGVVMMLFLIGLELRPNRLWQMRRPILGLGGSQVVLTSIAIALSLFWLTDYGWQTLIALGLALALSSTAIVLQSLAERGVLKTQTGQSVFSVLLFQDIAVIPILALLPLLAVQEASNVHGGGLMSHLAIHWQVVVTVATVAFIVVGGKYIAAPIFRFVASSRLREVFTALSLLIVVAIEALMKTVGLSPALGAFLAGVVLAESEFRHELEVDIEPFKGLLLGLFFITVGAGIDFQLLIDTPLTIGLGVLALVLIKGAVLALLSFLFKFPQNQGALFTVALAQGGEFAFVLVSMSTQLGIFNTDLGSTVTVIVALSMVSSPLMLMLHERYFGTTSQVNNREADTIDSQGEVIIAGYGRFGQIVGRLLSAQGYNLTILDHSPSQIDLLRRFGSKVFYGDAARRDLLEAAGAEEAKLLVVAVDEPDKSLDIIKMAQQHFPDLKILARAIDRRHTYELMRMNIAGIRRETFDSAIHLGVQALQILGNSPALSERAGKLFTAHDEESIKVLSELWGDDQSYGVAVRQRMDDLKQVLQNDRKEQEAINTCHAEQQKTTSS